MASSAPQPNHLIIGREGITLDGVQLLVEAGGVDITGYDSGPNDMTRVHLTLLAPKVTISR